MAIGSIEAALSPVTPDAGHSTCRHPTQAPRYLGGDNIEFSSRPARSHILTVGAWLKPTLKEQRSGGELQRFVMALPRPIIFRGCRAPPSRHSEP